MPMLKQLLDRHLNTLVLGACFVLVAFIGFNLGKIQSLQKTPLEMTTGANIYKAVSANTEAESGAGESSLSKSEKTVPVPRDLRVVVSKNSSSKKYHYSWCSGAKRIKPENQVWFESESAAQAAGYSLAGNCQ